MEPGCGNWGEGLDSNVERGLAVHGLPAASVSPTRAWLGPRPGELASGNRLLFIPTDEALNMQHTFTWWWGGSFHTP